MGDFWVQHHSTGSTGPDRAGIVVSLILLGLAGMLWRETQAMNGVVTYGVGPTAALKVVGIGLAILAVLTLISAFRGKGGGKPEPMDARPVLIIMAACIAMIAGIYFGAGYILSTMVLFAATATAFGRRKIHVDLAIGFAVAVVIYLLFSKILTLTLPQGPLERLIG